MASRPPLCALALFLPLAGGTGAAQTGLDLQGTWHVIVHYKDSQAHNPDAERWEDRVWVFRREEDRLRWVEYPIVVFDDKAGRFERSSTNRASRVLRYWEPNEAQRAALEAGPKVNSRGSRSKRLRGSDSSGWRSNSSSAAPSAAVITFTASWSIEDPTGHPQFVQEDVLGSGLTDRLEGGTRYETDTVEAAGAVLRGRYDRDGTRIGTFIATRTPPIRGLGTKEEQEARIVQKRRQMFMDQFFGGGAGLGMQDVSAELARQAQEGTLTDDDRKALRSEIRAAIEAQFRDAGVPLSQARPAIDSLTDQVERLLLEGKTVGEIETMFREGRIRP